MSEDKVIETSEINVDRIPSKPLTRRALKQNFRRKLNEVVEEAEKDALTGLPTRKAFNRRIKEEADRLARSGATKQTTVIVLDADKLKQINDSMGHAEGDRYLKSIADSLVTSIRRDTDFAARTGGDEFILLLPNTDLDGAETMWSDVLNPTFIKNGIAISGGAAELDPKDPDESIKRADSAMYGAKKERDRNGENLLFLYIPMKA